MKFNSLYSPEFEHDNCGIGAVVNIKGIKTHQTVSDALTIVENLEHRAGKDTEGKTGDGVGILLQISHNFFKKVALNDCNIKLENQRDYGVGMFFFPQNELQRNQAKKMFEIIVGKEGLQVLGWRKVPVDVSAIGERAFECMPYIMQCFIKRPENINRGLDFDRRLYITRRVFEQSNENTYIPSLSSRTIVYKGMFLVGDLRRFYIDLQDEDYESAIALVHSRFSTNTNPSWERAHPNRFIVHNGEINTIKGNADKMLAREENMYSKHLKDDMTKITPVINTEGSDSAMLDNALEFLVMSGMELPLALMITIPEPWENDNYMPRHKRDFYRYYATMMEPWDGPASIIFSDGDMVGAVLDRNGLRPSRYYITNDNNLILSSEVGALETQPEKIIKKDRLYPGKMLLVDTIQGKLIKDEDIKNHYASKQPYGEWLDGNLISLKEIKLPNQKVITHSKNHLKKLQKAFGYSYENVMESILPMAEKGSEPIASMGCDRTLAVLSEKPQPLFSYFKQLFAQVTNPPIDAIREKIITSTSVYMGKDGNILEEKPENCRVLKLSSPILTSTDMLKIKNLKTEGLSISVIPTLYYKNTKLENAITHLCIEADKAYREGATILILSDRGVDENHLAIPSLLAVSALHHYFVATKKRTSIDIILETGEPCEVHHFATLLGYGASAINPYLAHETIFQLINDNLLHKDYYASVEDYNNAILQGIVKIASKMGISTIQSYQGSQIFEALGISKAVIDRFFTGTVCRIGGIELSDIENTVEKLHNSAFDPLGLSTNDELASSGSHRYRSEKEEHLYNPQTIYLLQKSTKSGDYEIFKKYSKMISEEMGSMNIRGLFEFNYPEKSIPIEEVESAEEIVKRFKTGAMSYGSISQEAHEALAVAMNRIQGKSNSGEGGETAERIASGNTQDNRCSKIKQVASGRFGVTSEYLNSAEELQIKIAQGAKPGEGGHLPGEKVYPWIAKTRHSTTGVSLISPPPHHDIYSIEDLAQLVYDLKCANNKARISVKLVSECGVGTVAAGVAKAGADVVVISGFDGGTGAAPESSIYNAGLPWELGLAEAHQTLIMNNLRNKIILETDGKLMTGRDVAIASILGAEEFAFATAPLITLGCSMMRVCHLDTCPYGIATQNPELRKNFKGKPEYVINFMMFVAQELREIMADLGVKNLDELTGRIDFLRQKNTNTKLDLSPILNWKATKTLSYKDKKSNVLNSKNLLLKNFKDKEITVTIKNTDRSFGTGLGSEITNIYQNTLSENTFIANCKGSGGQSFGAFIPKGLTLRLEGDSNDYFGKGLSGGKLVIFHPENSLVKPDENIIIGNVALYGATRGEAFINGITGERFCVRNSGATAVVEGVGDHGCEYMTGGVVVILGKTGKNFAAGMSGGVAFVLDEDRDLYTRLNKELITFTEVTKKEDIALLSSLIEKHVKETSSPKAKEILNNFDKYLPDFKKIIPYDYEKMMNTISELEEKGSDREQAEVEAFKQIVNTD